MSKLKITSKELMTRYKTVVRASYGELQFLLRYIEPKYYNSGVYGWNYDVYENNKDIAICTGYRPKGEEVIDYKIKRDYDNRAREILKHWHPDYKINERKINKLIEKFTKEIRGV